MVQEAEENAGVTDSDKPAGRKRMVKRKRAKNNEPEREKGAEWALF